MSRRYYKKRYSDKRQSQDYDLIDLIVNLIVFIFKGFWKLFIWIIDRNDFEPKKKTVFGEKKEVLDYSNREIQTKRGEIVKSYGEKEIADYLYWLGVDYKYEHKYQRKDGGISEPDFYLPEFNVYIEYFGMMKYSKKYRFEMHLKFETFEKEGMKVIKIYEKHIKHKSFKRAINLEFKKLTGMDLPHPKPSLA